MVPGSWLKLQSACGEGKYVICICIVKSWLIRCGGGKDGQLFYGFVIDNTNDSVPDCRKYKLLWLILIKV